VGDDVGVATRAALAVGGGDDTTVRTELERALVLRGLLLLGRRRLVRPTVDIGTG
jgi:hypothetical protein